MSTLLQAEVVRNLIVASSPGRNGVIHPTSTRPDGYLCTEVGITASTHMQSGMLSSGPAVWLRAAFSGPMMTTSL
ncbi:hypothetical protein LEMLEM_LOCUS16552 [Lemmus lemmus]